MMAPGYAGAPMIGSLAPFEPERAELAEQLDELFKCARAWS